MKSEERKEEKMTSTSRDDCHCCHEILLISKVPAAQLSKTRLRQSLLHHTNTEEERERGEKTDLDSDIDNIIKSLVTAMLHDIFLQLLQLSRNDFHITWIFFPPTSDMLIEALKLVENVKSQFFTENPSLTNSTSTTGTSTTTPYCIPDIQCLPNTFNQKDLSIILQELYVHFQHTAR